MPRNHAQSTNIKKGREGRAARIPDAQQARTCARNDEMGKSTKPISPARRKKIIADYAMCGNYSEVARKHSVTPNTIKNIVQGDPKATKLCEQKAEEQSQNALQYLESQGGRINRLLGKILDAMEEKAEKVDMFTNIKDLAWSFGVLSDKALKVLEIKASINGGESGNINGQIIALGDLINNPQPNRTIEQVENK